MENNWLNLIHLLKKTLVSTEIAYHLQRNKQKIFNQLIKERSSEFWNLEKIINSDKLIYRHKTERTSLKHFRNNQNRTKLLKSLRDSNVNPKKVSKNQSNFKSHLGEIIKGNSKSDQRIK